MAENSKIEWTRHTFNPWRGCTKISPGCTNCYADTLSHRNPKTLGVWGPKGTRVVAAESAWREPVKWGRLAKEAGERHRVFCASLADVFEEWNGDLHDSQGRRLWVDRTCAHKADAPWLPETPQGSFAACRPLKLDDVRRRLFDLIDATPNLDWLLLTKRPENIGDMMTWKGEACASGDCPHWDENECDQPFRPNVWLGTSVEDQKRADERIPHLLAAPAAVRFLSCEPLLGPLEFSDVGGRTDAVEQLGKQALGGIHWVIVGGESGPGARPCSVDWIRSIARQCKAAAVPVFVKQLGAVPFDGGCQDAGDWWPDQKRYRKDFVDGREVIVRLLSDKKGGDPAEWPESFRVREFPTVRA